MLCFDGGELWTADKSVQIGQQSGWPTIKLTGPLTLSGLNLFFIQAAGFHMKAALCEVQIVQLSPKSKVKKNIYSAKRQATLFC